MIKKWSVEKNTTSDNVKKSVTVVFSVKYKVTQLTSSEAIKTIDGFKDKILEIKKLKDILKRERVDENLIDLFLSDRSSNLALLLQKKSNNPLRIGLKIKQIGRRY